MDEQISANHSKKQADISYLIWPVSLHSLEELAAPYAPKVYDLLLNLVVHACTASFSHSFCSSHYTLSTHTLSLHYFLFLSLCNTPCTHTLHSLSVTRLLCSHCHYLNLDTQTNKSSASVPSPLLPLSHLPKHIYIDVTVE